MPRKSKSKKTATGSSDVSKTLSNTDALDKVFDCIPDMVDSIMIKVEESKEKPMEHNRNNLEKEIATVKSDVESIKYDVMEILRQLPPRERKPPTFGDALGSMLTGMTGEGVTFQNVPYTKRTFTHHTTPNTEWNTTIGKIEEASSSEDDISEYSSDISENERDSD
jgi:hypothetical protein